MKILIGSSAIKYWYGDEFKRDPKDKDWAVNTLDGYRSSRAEEFLLIPPLFKRSLLEYGPYLPSIGGYVLPPNSLLTLKVSHIFWDINWDKHMRDIIFLLDHGAVINETLFYELYEYWTEFHKDKRLYRSQLENQTREDFFTNAINYDVMEHDRLHELINPIPIYTTLLKGEVELDLEKFKQLSHEEKNQVVREEIYVMAYERFRHYPYYKAYFLMFKKFLRQHAPLPIALHIIENYKELSVCKFNFIEHINKQLNNK